MNSRLTPWSTTRRLTLVGLALGWLASVPTAFCQGTTCFTYQGYLTDGGLPASGTYDLQFTLFGSLAGGSPVCPALTQSAVAISNGVFVTTVDFGSGVFDGQGRWLEIGVRPAGSAGGFTPLAPRSWMTPAPYALHANTAGTVVSGQVVHSLNGLRDDVSLAAGDNVSLTPQPGNKLEISAATVPGPKGLTWRGAWNGTIAYSADDAVFFNGCAWFARRANTGITPVDGPDWSLLAQKGDKGDTGPPGTIADGSVTSAKLASDGASLSKVSAGVMTRDSLGNVGIGTTTPAERLDVAGSIAYSGYLARLDVADNWEAIVRSADFKLGAATRRGAPGRALVDFTDRLCVNFDADWASTFIYGSVVLDPSSANDGVLSPGLVFGSGSGE